MKINNPVLEHRVKYLKEGDSLIAIDPCIMRTGGGVALIVGKRYEITSLIKDEIYITSELGPGHIFGLNKNSKNYIGNWFR